MAVLANLSRDRHEAGTRQLRLGESGFGGRITDLIAPPRAPTTRSSAAAAPTGPRWRCANFRKTGRRRNRLSTHFSVHAVTTAHIAEPVRSVGLVRSVGYLTFH